MATSELLPTHLAEISMETNELAPNPATTITIEIGQQQPTPMLSRKELLEARILNNDCNVPGNDLFPDLPKKKDVFQVCRTAINHQFLGACIGLEADAKKFRVAMGNFMVQCAGQYPEVNYYLSSLFIINHRLHCIFFIIFYPYYFP